MGKAFAVSVELDVQEDVESAQSRYLESIVEENRGREGTSGFSIRFQYDLEGTSHWEGELMVLEVSEGVCSLRYAGSDDTSEHVSPRELRARLRGAAPVPPAPRSRRFVVELESAWSKLRGKDLWEALELFRIAQVMES